MRKFIPIAAILIAFTGSQADELIYAPIPKTPPPPAIHGNYVLLATSSNSETIAKAARNGPGFATRTLPLRSLNYHTTITRNEIRIESRTSGFETRTTTTLPTTMEYTLDPTKEPMTIDVETIDLRGKKTKLLGVAEIKGNRLTIALGKEGGERPKTTDDADSATVYYFQKAPPPPQIEYRIVALAVGKEADAEKELNALVKKGYELVSTTNPLAPDGKSAVTTIHFILKRTVKEP